MNHAPVVDRPEAGADLASGLDRLVGGQAADASQEARQVLAVNELHGQEVHPVRLLDVVDAADVGVRDAACQPDLRQQSLESPGIATEWLRQELQSHRLPELEILGAVDLAHAALSDALDDAIPACEDPARDEALGLGPVRCGGPRALRAVRPRGRSRRVLEVHAARGA